MMRVIYIVVGLALIGYGVMSGNLITGLLCGGVAAFLLWPGKKNGIKNNF